VNDLSRLSDAELQALYESRRQSPSSNLSEMSDDQLKSLYAQRSTPSHASSTRPAVSQLDAAGRAALQGVTLNLSDEMKGLAAASPIPGARPGSMNAVHAIAGGARMLTERLWGSGSGRKAYSEAVMADRKANEAARKDNPWTYFAGELAGGVAVPLGAVGHGLRGMTAAGAGYGAAAGFGAGEGAADSALGAGVGGVIGGAIGAAIPSVAQGVGALARATGLPQLVRGSVNPTRQAEREVAEAFARDARGTAPRLDAADFAAGRMDGQPVVVADMGGESVRRQARAASNLSTEASDALRGVTEPRYDGQADRFRNFMDDMFGGPNSLDSTRLADDIAGAARSVNTPAYAAANKAAESVTLWDDTLHALSQSPAVYKAMQGVDERAANRAVREGVQPIRNPFTRDENGFLQWRTLDDGSTVTPNLEYWNIVKQNLDDEIGSRMRAGENGRARDIIDIRDQLVTHIDNMVPEYAAARSGAAAFFKADNALEAGQKFLSASKDINITDAAKALRAMSPEERGMFERGFAAELMRRTQGAGNVARIFDNPTMKQKIGMAMGDDRAGALEAFARREQIMQILKERVGGNSSTAQQLISTSTLGGAGIGFGAGGDPFSMTAGAALGTLTRAGQLKVKEKVAREIGQILTSTDPAVITQIMARSENPGAITKAMGEIQKALTKGATQRGGAGASASVAVPAAEDNEAAPGLSRGGFVDEVEDMIRKRIMGDGDQRPFDGYAEGGRVGILNRLARPFIRAYHGSPHDFDKFDMSKIGTGEGAQTFGHGLYFADNEAVARSYRDSLSGLRNHVLVDGTPVKAGASIARSTPEERAAIFARQALDEGVDLAQKARAIRMRAREAEIAPERLTSFQREGGWGDHKSLNDAASILDDWAKRDVRPDRGRMYEVNIHASPDDFLDWDKPLREQGANVQGVLGEMKHGPRPTPSSWKRVAGNDQERPHYADQYGSKVVDHGGWFTAFSPNGQALGDAKSAAKAKSLIAQEADFFNSLRGEDVHRFLGPKPEAAKALRDRGIPGIKYLDQGSRAAGDGSRNYVVFRDDIIDILRKYGIMAPVAGGAVASAQGRQEGYAGGGKVRGGLDAIVSSVSKWFPEDRRLRDVGDPAAARREAENIASRMKRSGDITDADSYADWILSQRMDAASKALPNADLASQFADHAASLGYRPKPEWDRGGSAYVPIFMDNLTRSGQVNRRTPEIPLMIGLGDRDAISPLRSAFKARFADHAPYYRSTVSVDPVSGNKLDDALSLLDWVKGGKVGPPPLIRDAYIIPGTGDAGRAEGYKKFWSTLPVSAGALSAMSADGADAAR
jgi:hypothetical protein